MSTQISYNGSIYFIPSTGDQSWGDSLTAYLIALSTGSLSHSGGIFQLTGDLNFGSTNGIVAEYFSARNGVLSSNIASAGSDLTAPNRLRLGVIPNATPSSAVYDAIAWRNNANTSDLRLLPHAGTETILSYGGIDLVDVSSPQTLTNKTISGIEIVGAVLQDGTKPLTASWAAGLFSATFNNVVVGSATNSISGLATIVNSGTLTLPTSTDTLVGRNTTDTLTNKTFASPSITGQLELASGSANIPAYSFTGNGNVGMYNVSGTLGFATNGIAALTINGSQAATFTSTISASNFSGSSSGSNTGDQTITLTSEATGTGTGSFSVTLANSAVIGKVLTGYTSGAGTVSATDSILQAIQKLNGNASGISGSAITSLTGEATASGPGASATTLSNSAVIGKVLTGYTSGSGTISATDSILSAIQKLNGNDGLKLPLAGGTLTGTLNGTSAIFSSTVQSSGFSGPVTGNASTATALQTARAINGVNFDGTAAITVTAAAGTLTGTTLNSTVVSSSLTSVGTLANLTVTNPISGSVTGSAATVTTNANLTGPVTSVGNATTIGSGQVSDANLAVSYLKADGTRALTGNWAAGSFSATHNSVVVGSAANTISGLSTIVNTGTITLPTATDTLVARTTTDTLTNKTISGASNTLSNIADGSLSTSYIKADGTRALTGNWAAGSFSATHNSVVVGSAANTISGLTSITCNADRVTFTGSTSNDTTVHALSLTNHVSTFYSRMASTSTTGAAYFITQQDSGTKWSMGMDLVSTSSSWALASSDGFATSSLIYLKMSTSGSFTIGATSATQQHALNTATGTAAAGVGTITNLPIGKSGNPTGYVQITINGTTAYVPFW